jgi:hypothetical protein
LNTPEEFIAKWRAAELKERSAAQEHFIDLCRLLDQSTPTEADPTGDFYTFEKGAPKTAGPTRTHRSTVEKLAQALGVEPTELIRRAKG